jgi:hypothetical protein
MGYNILSTDQYILLLHAHFCLEMLEKSLFNIFSLKHITAFLGLGMYSFGTMLKSPFWEQIHQKQCQNVKAMGLGILKTGKNTVYFLI